MKIRDFSIRAKLTLITMVVSSVALLLASGAFVTSEILQIRRQILDSTVIDAQMVGNNSTATLSFHNPEEAADVLSALRAEPGVDAAWIFTPDGKVFATYFRDKSFPRPDPKQMSQTDHVFTSDKLQVWRPIALNGQPLGIVAVQSNLSALSTYYRNSVHIILLVLCGSMLAALLLSRRLQSFISRPILGLTDTAKRISAEKNYALRATLHGNDELGLLVNCFNEMLQEIQKRDQRLQAQQENLEEVVALRTDELVQVNAELQEAKDKAEHANRAKSAFLANMSHEIRTPMTAIVGYADLMLEPQQSPSDRQDCLQVIRRNAAHLLELINDILDLSKIEADKMSVEKIKVDLPQIVTEVVSMMRPRAAEKGLAFELKFDDPTPRFIHADPLRLKQILVNLLGNAVKFTSCGRIGLRVSHAVKNDGRSSTIRFAISDTGIGIGPEQIGKLFQSFSQADESMTRRFGGTGLGLTISKRLAALLGGDINVQSTLGVGSIFTIEIDGGSLADVEMLHDLSEATLGPIADATPVKNLKLRGRILFAEDGLDNQRLISTHLRKAGAEVVIAPNGKIALEIIAKEHFDLVLMDMQMPVLDGYAAASQMRQKGYKQPIIALTAHAMSDDRMKCIQAGCTDYLTKPIERNTLLHAVASHMAAVVVPENKTQRSTMSDEPDMKALVEEYVANLPGEVVKLKELLETGEIEPLRRIAHQLKGSGGGYGFSQLTELAALADRCIKQGASIDLIREQVNAMIDYIRGIEGYEVAREAKHAAESTDNR